MGKNILKFTRGQVWWVNAAKYDVDPQSHIQQKDRPYLIVSCNENNRISPTFNAVPITKQDKNPIPSHVTYTIYDKQNTILCEQIRTFDMDDLSRYCYVLNDKIMEQVDVALANQLCINTFGSSIDNLMGVIDNIIEKKRELSYKDEKISDKVANDIAEKLNLLFTDSDNKLSKVDEINEIKEEIEEKVEDKSVPIVESKPSNMTEKRTPISNIKSDGTKKWTQERKKQFLEDCDKHPIDTVAKMWGLKNKQSVYSYKYLFAKEK